MSEYQFYEFTAVDRPLAAREQAELRALSTRADITATSFVNTYHWGNFKGDPRKLMERYFDAHLYLTNWGTHEIMLRLPKRVLDPAIVGSYCVGDHAAAWTVGQHLVIAMYREDEDGDDEFETDGHGLLASIIPARAALATGDLRLLYLGWLRCVQSDEVDDDQPEPPVPAGLGALDASLTALADFLHIDTDLIAAAATGSASANASTPTRTQLRRWITGLPARDKDDLLIEAATGSDNHIRSRLLRRFRDEHPAQVDAPTAPRAAGELRAAAADTRARRERRDAEERDRERVRRDRDAAAARQLHLDALAVDQPAAWQRIDTLIACKKPRDYDTAVQLLVDLRDVADREGEAEQFRERLTELRIVHARKPSLIERFDLAALDG